MENIVDNRVSMFTRSKTKAEKKMLMCICIKTILKNIEH